jgi:hypothetical protein
MSQCVEKPVLETHELDSLYYQAHFVLLKEGIHFKVVALIANLS